MLWRIRAPLRFCFTPGTAPAIPVVLPRDSKTTREPTFRRAVVSLLPSRHASIHKPCTPEDAPREARRIQGIQGGRLVDRADSLGVDYLTCVLLSI